MSATFPPAPGQLGVAARPSDLLAFLGALDAWLSERRAELDTLDQAVVAAGRQAELTGDIALALALWQAAKSRSDLMLTTWDSGRVGQAELEKLSGLIWGRLDTAGSSLRHLQSMSVSLPEAGRLCDALAAQLRTRLSLDPNAQQQSLRIRDLRAQMERLRDQVAQEPPDNLAAAQREVAALAARTEDLAGKRSRGGDVGGLLGPLEIDAARFERDLIVGAAQRREARELLARARATQAELTAREAAMRELVNRTTAAVWPAPRYAVPDPGALGPLPNTKEALGPYLDRLAQVDRALRVVQQAYEGALLQREQAQARLVALGREAGAAGHGGDPDLAALARLAEEQLRRAPTVLAVADHLVSAYAAHLEWLTERNPS